MTPLLTARASSLRIFSYGGGVQSNAVLVLQAQGKLANPYDAFVFANVGADSENPATLDYIETVAKPFAQKHGIELIEVAHPWDTILQRIYRTKRSIVIPLRMSGGKPATRACTVDFKIRIVNKWIADQHAQWATVGMGISLDEWQRLRDTQWHAKDIDDLAFNKRREYPLINLHLRRADCHQIITSAGLPDAPKSSCWFCPHRHINELRRSKRDTPEEFVRIVAIEEYINLKRSDVDPVRYLQSLIPLNRIDKVNEMFPEYKFQACDEGVCDV